MTAELFAEWTDGQTDRRTGSSGAGSGRAWPELQWHRRSDGTRRVPRIDPARPGQVHRTSALVPPLPTRSIFVHKMDEIEIYVRKRQQSPQNLALVVSELPKSLWLKEAL